MKFWVFILTFLILLTVAMEKEEGSIQQRNKFCQRQTLYDYFKSLIKMHQKIINSKLKTIMASVFVTHGGGPMPLYQPEQHEQFTKHLKQISKRFPNPKGIIVFSAHWQESDWTLLDHDNPPLYYDYYGFPPQTYNLKYSMSSSTETRAHIRESLLKQGINLKSDKKRGYDHGVFIPMMIMYPDVKVPVVQISILSNLNPETHYRMGVAVRNLKKEGFLILGSGSSSHGSFFEKQAIKWSQSFDQELGSLVVKSKNDKDLLTLCLNWKNLPFAKEMHPREEHLVPLFVNLGAHQGDLKQHAQFFLYSLYLSNFILS